MLAFASLVRSIANSLPSRYAKNVAKNMALICYAASCILENIFHSRSVTKCVFSVSEDNLLYENRQ